jgi:hypothetical protein
VSVTVQSEGIKWCQDGHLKVRDVMISIILQANIAVNSSAVIPVEPVVFRSRLSIDDECHSMVTTVDVVRNVIASNAFFKSQ